MSKVLGWVGFALSLPVALLFMLACLGLLFGGDLLAAVVSAVIAGIAGAGAWGCLRLALRHRPSKYPPAGQIPIQGPGAHVGVSGSGIPQAPAPPASPPSRPIENVRTIQPPAAPPARTTARKRPAVVTRRPPTGRPGISFRYAQHGGREAHSGPFAVVDVETTGFAADGDDRVVEVAVVRVDEKGRIEDEWATLINPGRDTGPVFIHHITEEAVAHAPTFPEIAEDLLARLSGSVIVAHNATFDEGFLRAELARAGYRGLQAPAFCSLWLSRQTLTAPNYKLGTLGRLHNVASIDTHSALGDARTAARLIPLMLDQHASPLSYGCVPYQHTGTGSPTARLVTRASSLRKGDVGWMNNLIDRLPLTANDVTDEVAHRYLEALGEALADGKIVGAEAKQLARIAGQAGMGGAQVRALNERFLEGLREAAYEDSVLTDDEVGQLQRASSALGVDGYFDDLVSTPTAHGSANVAINGRQEVATDAPLHAPSAPPTQPEGVDPSANPMPVKQVRRCGHCRQPGHYRTTCPQLTV